MGQVAKPLTREGFLKRYTFRDVELVDGTAVRIRALPASYIVGGAEDRFTPANLLINSLCDEGGALMFAAGEDDKAMTVDGASLKTIMDAILDLNGLAPSASGGEASAAEKN